MAFTFLSFFFLTCSFLSVWVRREPKIWGSLLGVSLFFGWLAGNILWTGLVCFAVLVALWIYYVKKTLVILFAVLVVATLCLKLHLIPGFHPISIVSKFQIGLEGAVIGLLPLGLLVPVARSFKDWKMVLKGFLVGCFGIGVLAVLATIMGATRWEFKLPTFMSIRTWSNLILTSIPEEAFYRGFLQKTLCDYFQNTNIGKVAALILTSILFTFAHVYWCPNLAILIFVFLAGLLYGGVYWISGKIESAILCHFLLNLIHMIFFEYHAM